MEFTAGCTYEITGFVEAIDRKMEKKLAFLGLSLGAYFKVMRVDADNLTIETSLVKTTLSRKVLNPLLIKKK